MYSFSEINEYAIQIGINPKTEPHLLYLARDGLLQAIPAEWQIWWALSNVDCTKQKQIWTGFEHDETFAHSGFVSKFVMHKKGVIQNAEMICFFFRFKIFTSYNDECDGYYYFNTKTKVRQWEHPLDGEYKKLVEKARRTGATTINDLSDVMNF